MHEHWGHRDVPVMINRVAKAIEDCHDDGAWSPYEMIGHDVALECARAAIEAMREHTKGMYDAANEAVFKEGHEPSLPNIVWQAMIDAALTSD